MNALTRPIDSSSLIFFRLVTGILIAQELINGLFLGKFHEYTAPAFHFSYLFFEWIRPWPYWGMVVHYTITILAALGVAFNFKYRLSSILLFAGHASLFLMEQTEYINHAYLYSLITFWLMVLPLNQKHSHFPAWMLYIILFHMGLAYFYGGIAKLNSDWIAGRPMNLFLEHRKYHLLGYLYQAKWAASFFSYGGILFDLLIVPLMIIKRTRAMGFILSLCFHLSNVVMFGLATFPWFSLLLTSLFFDPSWPRKIPLFSRYLVRETKSLERTKLSPLLLSGLGLYVLVHLSLPLRHWLYPGFTSWTEEGHMFSWRMMLRHKRGTLSYFVHNKTTGEITPINPLEFITQRQYGDIIGKPDLMLQFAHFLRDHYRNLWSSEVSVFASSRVSLNGRPKKEMIRPGTDLAREERSLLNYEWILPLDETQSPNYSDTSF